MGGMSVGHFIDMAPQTAYAFPEGLEVDNRSEKLVRVLFDAADRRLDFEYFNARGEKVSSNALFGPRVRKIEIHDSPLRGIDLLYFA